MGLFSVAEALPAVAGAGPMRIVHLLSPAPFGGLERVVEMLAAGQQGRGDTVHVLGSVGPGGEDHPFLTTLRQRGISCTAITNPSRAYLTEYRDLRHRLSQLAPDIAHSHGYRSDALTVASSRPLGIPVVSTAHGFVGGSLRNLVYEQVQRQAWKRCAAVVAVSRPLVGALSRAGIRHPILIPNAWSPASRPHSQTEARQLLAVPADVPLIGWVGRFSKEKGADIMLEAFGRMATNRAHLVFIGDGGARPELEARAAQLGLQDRVHFAGVVPEAGRLFTAFDCFALSSRSEGTPIALLEAMSAGVPIVATTVGGVPDVVGPGEAGLVPPEDPGALAVALDDLLRNPQQAAIRVRAATDRLTLEFGPERWLDAYEAVYRRVGGARAPGPTQ